MANEVAKTSFSNFLTSPIVKAKINEVIGGEGGQRFMTQILSAVTNNPALQECEPMTLLNCAFLGESLKLSPSPQLGQYYMVPFKDKRNNRTVATFQLGYKGYIQLAIRSGQYKKLNVLAIKHGELINFDPLNEEINVDLIKDEEVREATKTIGYYAMFEYTNGFKKAMYWSMSKMEAHANKYSQAFNIEAYRKLQNGEIPQADMWKYSSFWYKDFDGMAYKTMLRQLISKWGIMSIDMQMALDGDMAATDDKGGKIYVEESNTPSFVSQPPEAEPQKELDITSIVKKNDQQASSKTEVSPVQVLADKLKADKVKAEDFYKANKLTTEDLEEIKKIISDDNYYSACLKNVSLAAGKDNLALLKAKLTKFGIDIDKFFDINGFSSADSDIISELVQNDKKFSTYQKNYNDQMV